MNAQMQPSSYNSQQFKSISIKISEQLLDEAIWSGEYCTWTGDDMDLIENEWKIVHKTVDSYLYSGLTGIASFLLKVWEETQDERYKKTIIACLKQVIKQGGKTEYKSVGLYNGLAGVVMVILDAGRILNCKELSSAGLQLYSQLEKQLNNNELPDSYDIIDGLAGILLALVYLNEKHQLKTLNISHLIAEKIIAGAVDNSHGLSWPIQGENEGLTGFAHGVSGIAHALMVFSHRTQHQQAYKASFDAIRFENSLFETQQSNWASCSSVHSGTSEQSIKHQLNWCHGAAGIGLSRLYLYQITANDSFLADAGVAIQACEYYISSWTPQQKNYQDNLSTCHGYGSMAELFIFAYQVLGNQRYLDMASVLAHRGLEARRGKYWPVGVPGARETPGLMTGLSGIGWWYLMLSEPVKMPPSGLPCAPLNHS